MIPFKWNYNLKIYSKQLEMKLLRYNINDKFKARKYLIKDSQRNSHSYVYVMKSSYLMIIDVIRLKYQGCR